MHSSKPGFWTVIGWGVRRRCPHCGRDPLFVSWFTLRDRCRVCGLVYQRNYGDTWFFWIIGDRIPIAVGIALVYFGLRTTSWAAAAGFFFAMVVPLIWTMPHRLGVAIGLSYLSRVYLRDPSDELPPIDAPAPDAFGPPSR